MHKILISIPGNLTQRLRVAIPARQRSKIIAHLILQEIERRENELYTCALEVEEDEALNKEMKEWDATLSDGLENESW